MKCKNDKILAQAFGDHDHANKNINKIILPHTTPLGYYSNMLPSNATVEVPKEAVETYKSTDGWKDYNIVGY